ncbi:MAG: DUF1292 domain-containing protein [Lachnospiraceae bacterium]|nr:DUF1292 domain-containing protein [Lachnospiraceae bacterium]
MEQIEFLDVESGEPVFFYVLEQTTLGGERYLLVSDKKPEEDEANAFIFCVKGDDGAELTYEEVEDEQLLSVLSGVFEELLEDVSIN